MNVTIRALREGDLDDADRIFRLAFGTFLDLPDPSRFGGDTDFIRSRWRANPEGVFAAEIDGRLVGSNFATRWGSFAFFGPLTVRPDLWDRGVARRLLEPTMAVFDRWGVTHRGLFTFSHSAKHHALYQKFGFYPRFLTAVMGKKLHGDRPLRLDSGLTERFSTRSDREHDRLLHGAREVTDSVHPGLDLTHEIRATHELHLGDTVFLAEGDRVDGFAVCHVGPGSEAGTGRCYAKFAAVRCGAHAERSFAALVDAIEAFTASVGATTVAAGVNLARESAYRELIARGYRAEIVGVAMQSPNEPGPNRADVFALDDWR